MLEQLRVAGVQQAHKEDKITFTSVDGWPGKGYVCAEGRFMEGETERRAGIFVGPEFGTVSKEDLTAAAREAAEMGFDLLIACAFSYDARATDMNSLGRVTILKARMNADLHMATDLKATDKGNLFVIFGEPDVRVEDADRGDAPCARPRCGRVRSLPKARCGATGRRASPAGSWTRTTTRRASSSATPTSSARTTRTNRSRRPCGRRSTKDAWESLHSDVSRPFPRPDAGPHRRQDHQPPRRRGDEGDVNRCAPSIVA